MHRKIPYWDLFLHRQKCRLKITIRILFVNLAVFIQKKIWVYKKMYIFACGYVSLFQKTKAKTIVLQPGC